MGNIINPNEYGGLLFDNNEVDAVKNVLLNKKIFRYALKEKSQTDIFEESICKRYNKKYALGVNSGTSGLKVALKSIGLRVGDRVLVSAYTFIATATSVLALGGIPIPIDTDLEYGMNLEDLENELKKGCKAIILVHFQGKCFDLKPIIKLKKKYKVLLIEDACQAMETKCNGIYAGTLSDIGVFSFQQNKPLTSGEGGIIITDNEKYYTIARNYSDMGSVRDYYPSWDKSGALIGDNYRMNNIQGAILNEQLKKLDKMVKMQIKNKMYILNNINNKDILCKILNNTDDNGMNILFLTNSVENANKCIEIASKKNIEIRHLWSKPYYLQKVIIDANLKPKDLGKKDCLMAEKISNLLLSINLPPTLTKKDLDIISKLLNKLIKEKFL